MNFRLARDQIVLLENHGKFVPSRRKANDFFAVFFNFWVGRFNKTLNDWPRGRTLRVSDKQNSLFPLGPVIKFIVDSFSLKNIKLAYSILKTSERLKKRKYHKNRRIQHIWRFLNSRIQVFLRLVFRTKLLGCSFYFGLIKDLFGYSPFFHFKQFWNVMTAIFKTVKVTLKEERWKGYTVTVCKAKTTNNFNIFVILDKDIDPTKMIEIDLIDNTWT